MAYWLLKTEPGTYSWDDLVRDGRTTWDGISNNAALLHMRKARAGDLALIYHTGGERRAMGVVEVLGEAHPDPKEEDPKLLVVEIAAREPLAHPVELGQVKARPEFQGSPLVREGRLSFVPLTPAQWRAFLALAKKARP